MRAYWQGAESGLAKRGAIGIVSDVRCLLFMILFCLPAVSWLHGGLAEKVVILANSQDEDSMRIARHYAAKRGVPEANIVALPMPTVETINWRDFVLTIWQPLQDELMQRERIDGTAFKLFDDAGRRKVAVSGHDISYLVICRGVPLRINHNAELLTTPSGREDRPELRTNRASVDAELSLLAYGPYNINGFVHNPLFRVKEPSLLTEKMIVKVARLDGPQYDDVIALINRTLEAEKNGLIGRGYVDVRGPHRQGNQWMELIVNKLQAMHFAPEVNQESGTFPMGTRSDQPALYFGWYAGKANGPFLLPGFRFAPGAIAVHIHSYSAATLRSDSAGWCSPLIVRGAAVTTGAVFEPYLQFMHYPHLMLEALARGKNVGDAAYYALASLSWQNVLIGDPLYQPFLRGLDEQWLQRTHLAPRQRPYVALREMQRLDEAGLDDEALAVGQAEQAAQPSLVMGVQLAEMFLAREDAAGAIQALGFAPLLKQVVANDWVLLQRAGDLLEEAGDKPAALRVYGRLFEQPQVPDVLRIEWLRRGVRLASAAGDLQRAMAWEQEANRLAAETKNRADSCPPHEGFRWFSAAQTLSTILSAKPYSMASFALR